LTGLANRSLFHDRLEHLLCARQPGRTATLMMLDLDRFKAINDEHGHAAGDELLRSVAQECVPRLPRGALLARHGGDEFALLLPSCSGAAALRVVEELRIACSRVPLSAGVAQHAPGELASQLMRRADTALYRAKAGGRGRCALHDGDQDDGPAPSGTARRAVRD
jgi:diguanylate cyclase (GGDEF)-like protein